MKDRFKIVFFFFFSINMIYTKNDTFLFHNNVAACKLQFIRFHVLSLSTIYI